MPNSKNLVALGPGKVSAYLEAIKFAGAEVVELSGDVEALIWTDYSRPELLAETLDNNPQLKWVQLPFAGVDAFKKVLDRPITFTSAKRSYSEPVAEHGLALSLALARVIPERVTTKTWGRQFADSLFDQDVLIVGGGGIAESFASMLKPFRSKVVVVRKRPDESFLDDFQGKVVGFEEFNAEVAKAKLVMVACALTDQTKFLFDRRVFSMMRSDSYLVNVARGEVVNQEDLVEALRSGQIAAAATDVTYPEPLPDEHEMWQLDNLLITPHTADTKEIVTALFAERLRVNVAAWLSGKKLTGVVDPKLGY
ncbi:D-isomer specific 2-hydroxyacid dehydrogenase family protein [Aquiluna sp.]|nr:D-isomer specific 2-hydroxyacid dehydrogenase family protein [Aquiluna sp.]